MNTEKIHKRVRVITDSVAQVPPDVARQLEIKVVPYSVTINNTTYLDGIDLQPDALYQRMRVEKIIPKTSAPSPGVFIKVIQQCIQENAGSIFCVILSSNLSMCYNSVVEAAEIVREDLPGIPIEVFDTRQAAISEGYIAIEAAKSALSGANLEQVRQVARETQKRVGLVVSFDSLEYLSLGGRIGKAAYLLGSLIDIKPIITVSSEGVVEPLGKAFGNQKALEAIIDHVEKTTSGCKHLKLALMDADAAERVETLKAMAVERLKPDEMITTSITPVMGAHTGPGLVGLGYNYS